MQEAGCREESAADGGEGAVNKGVNDCIHNRNEEEMRCRNSVEVDRRVLTEESHP